MSTSLRLRNVLESLRKNLNANKWQEILNLLQSKSEHETVSVSHKSLILELIQRDLSPLSKHELIVSCLSFVSQVLMDSGLLSLFHIDQLGSLMNAVAILFNHHVNHECHIYSLKCMEYHVLPIEHWESWGIPMMQGLLHSPTLETFNLIPSILKKTPHLTLGTSFIWFPQAIKYLFSQDIELSLKCKEFLDKISLYFLSESESEGKWIQKLVDTSSQECLLLLESNTSHPAMVLQAVSFIILAFGCRIHRTRILNQILNIIETQFNASKFTCRSLSFQTWRRLILNFKLKGHLYHAKRVNLILIPLWNGLKYEKNQVVYKECVSTFAFLLLNLCQDSKLFKDVLRKSCSQELLNNSVFTSELISILCAWISKKEYKLVEYKNLYSLMDSTPSECMECMNPIQDPTLVDFLLSIFEKFLVTDAMQLTLFWNAILKYCLSLQNKQLHIDEMDSFLKRCLDYPEMDSKKLEPLQEILRKARFACSELSGGVYSQLPLRSKDLYTPGLVLEDMNTETLSHLDMLENIPLYEPLGTMGATLGKRKRENEFVEKLSELTSLEYTIKEVKNAKELIRIQRDLQRLITSAIDALDRL